MNLPLFIAKRITLKSKRTFSKLIVRIAVLSIMLGLAVMLLAVAIVKGFKSEIREKVRGFAGDIEVIKYDLNASFENSPFTINQGVYNDLKKIPGVEYIQPVATKPGIINTGKEIEGVVLKGIDKSYNTEFYKKILDEGKMISISDSVESQKQILISRYTANRLNLKVGDDFLMYFVQEPLRKRKFEIVGIYNLGVEDIDKMYVIGDISLIRRLNNWKPTDVGAYEIRVKDFKKINEINNIVYDRLALNLKSFTVEELYPTIFQWLSLLDINTQVILALMLAVAVINMISALLIMILERTNMIGVLKALGNSNWEVRKIFLYNATYLIGLGMLFGNILGLGLGFLQQYTHLFKLSQESYFISFIPVEFSITDMLLLNAGTLAICLMALIIPSLLVSKVSPVKAIAFK